MLAPANKWALWLLLLLPLLYYWYRFLLRRGERFIRISSVSLFPETGSSLKFSLIRILPYIKMVIFFLLIITLARPQKINQNRVEENRGIDILLTLDISGSMASIDFKPKNRLEVAKEVIARFIEKRTSDRIGLVIFAGNAFTKCPLTVDYSILTTFLQESAIGDIEDGTALGMALATSVNRLRHSKAKTKIVILLTDGVNNRGEIDPRDAARLARDYDIKVYTIGAGTEGEAPYPVTDYYGNKRFVMARVEIDEALLKDIASNTGGLYFRATDSNSLQQIFIEIDRYEKSKIAFRTITERIDLFPWFLAVSLFLLALVETSRRTFLRSLP